MMKAIRVIVVDDSAFMRKSISMLLESDPDIQVVATARDGLDGIEKIRQLRPDAITLDIQMPRMDGLTALKIIMKEYPLPVLVISSVTTKGAQVTLEALSYGAADFVPKELANGPLNIIQMKSEIIAKIKSVVNHPGFYAKIKGNGFYQETINDEDIEKIKLLPGGKFAAVVLGISTGGPFALNKIIPRFPADFPVGMAIVQHIPPNFTRSLAEKLNKVSAVQVKEAEDGEKFSPGKVFIATGGRHLTFRRNNSEIYLRVSSEPNGTLFCPSVDVMMSSAAENFAEPLLAVIMTGMGKDGTEGLRLIKKNNGFVIAQNEETCVVYGMPREAVEKGLADLVLPLASIPGAIARMVSR